MHRRGHYGVSLLLYAPIGYHLLGFGRGPLAVLAGAIVLVGTPLPDYDQKTSLVAHRGFTHTFPFAALFGAALGAVGWTIGDETALWAARDGFVYGFGTGAMAICSHMAGDVITPAGIRPFAPLSDYTLSVGIVRAGNPPANDGLLVLGILATGYVAVVAVQPGLLP